MSSAFEQTMKPSPSKQFYFDLSSSARWGGNAVGIIRVERELAKRAKAELGDAVQFCIFDRVGRRFLHLPTPDALDIINGRSWFSFEPSSASRLTFRLSPRSIGLLSIIQCLPQEISYQLLLRPKAYIFVQRLRGRRLSAADVEKVRGERESVLGLGGKWAEMRWRVRSWLLRRPRLYRLVSSVLGRKISLDDAMRVRDQQVLMGADHVTDVQFALQRFQNRVNLNENSVVISCGLDWDHKDIRSIYQLKKEYRFKYHAVLYDLIPLKFPHFVVPGYDALLRDYIGELVWAADHVLCISKTTHEDLAEYVLENNVVGGSASVFPLGNDLPGQAETDGQKNDVVLPPKINGRRFGLFVSTIEPRKNHRVLYEAWDECVRAGTVDPSKHCLVFAGRRGWGTDDLVREIESNPATRDSILVLNHISDDVLSELYRRSAFNLFPSHYEGYGLPLAEALLAGKAAFASDAGALAEIGGDLVVRLRPKDIQSWAQMLSRAMTDIAYVNSLSERVQAEFKSTSWDSSAREFFASVRKASMR